MDMLELRSSLFPSSQNTRRVSDMRSVTSKYGIRPRVKKTSHACDPEQHAEYVRLCAILGRTPDPNAVRFGEILMTGIINTLKREIERNGK